MKRDDLTGLGVGGNKARKLEFLCGQARRAGARSLVTVGAAQSNHCRMTAAAGAVLGMEVHLVLAGDRPARAEGNQLLYVLFGAQLHFVGCPEHHWGELEIAREQITDELAAAGAGAAFDPDRREHAGGRARLRHRLPRAARRLRRRPHPPGGDRAHLLERRHPRRPGGRSGPRPRRRPAAPPVLAIGVAKGVAAGQPDIAELAASTLAGAGLRRDAARQLVVGAAVEVDGSWIGEDYAVPTPAGDEAIVWAARHGGWVLDRTYTGKGLAGLLGHADAGRWGRARTWCSSTPAACPPSSPPGGLP